MDPNLISALRTAFSSEYAFLVKAQNAFFNVQGDDYFQASHLFKKIFKDVQESIKPMGKMLRKCQVFVPVGLSKMANLSIVADFPAEDIDCMTYYQILLADSDALAELFAAAVDVAEKSREYGLADFLADRQDAHRGYSWMLRMNLVPEPAEPAAAAGN
jgi:DNA-binding ferritin-like protein